MSSGNELEGSNRSPKTVRVIEMSGDAQTHVLAEH
jgi:hypothetical protein